MPGEKLSLAGVGELTLIEAESSGFKYPADQSLYIRFRQGGERCKPFGRQHSQSLKKLFQEYRVEPWWRDRVPLIYSGDQLLAAGDYWVCSEAAVAPDECGYRLLWK